MSIAARKLALLLVLGVLGYGTASGVVVYRLTHRSSPQLDEEPAPVAVVGLQALRIHTHDGEQLGAWYLPGRTERPVALLLHGNGRSRVAIAPALIAHAQRGDGVLAVSLRAHGDSSGERHQVGLDAREDVRAAVAWLRTHASERTLILSGFSLGAVASLYASDELGHEVQGYLLDAPYSSLLRAVRNRTRAALPWGLEWLAYQGLRMAAPLGLSRPLTDFEPARQLARIPAAIPVTLLGSLSDRASPHDELTAMAKARADTRLVIVAGQGHRPLFETDLQRYLNEFERVLCKARREHPCE
jgi:alpha-beta hydrolase superfamily lysophospholipase